MKKQAGLWIDHRKAFIVFVENNHTETRLIESKVERQPGRLNGKKDIHSEEAQMEKKDNTRNRRFLEHLHGYYKKVASLVNNANHLIIFGPGSAKTDLKTVLEENNQGVEIDLLETADKMTDPQFIARVKAYFVKKTEPSD